MGFHDHIWNHHEKCIQISTNMPGIGSLIRKIDVKISEIWETNILFLLSKTNTRILSVKITKITWMNQNLLPEFLRWSCCICWQCGRAIDSTVCHIDNTIWSVPVIATITPWHHLVEGGKEVEQCVCYHHVVVDAHYTGDDAHGKTKTCEGREGEGGIFNEIFSSSHLNRLLS